MTLNVTVKKRIATYVSGQGIPVCGNTGDQVKFTFDEEWSQHETKTARFKWGGKVFDQEFTGNICEIPNIDNADFITVGVFVGEEEDGEDELSTTDTKIPYRRSTRCGNNIPHGESGESYTNLAKGYAVSAKADAVSAKADAERAEAAAERAEQAEANMSYVVQTTGDSVTAIMSQNAVSVEFEKSNQKISRVEKRITNLEQGLVPDPFETDDSVAYMKDVPANALPYAEVSMVGGMTYKDEASGTLKSAKVTAVKSVGKNLFNFEAHVRNGGKTTIRLGINKALYRNGKGSNVFECKAYDNNNTLLASYDSTGFPSKTQFTFPSTTAYITIKDGLIGSDFHIGYDSDYEYKPYAETIFPIPEAVQALDGYGDGLTADCNNYIDCEKKQFVKRAHTVDLGTLTWVHRTGSDCFRAYLSQPATIGNVVAGKEICCGYTTIASSDVSIDAEDKTIAIGVDSAVYVIDRTFGSDVTTFKAALAGVLLCYELATTKVTDISDLITSDNMLAVEGNGAITFENENGLAVPSEVTYQLKGVTV